MCERLAKRSRLGAGQPIRAASPAILAKPTVMLLWDVNVCKGILTEHMSRRCFKKKSPGRRVVLRGSRLSTFSKGDRPLFYVPAMPLFCRILTTTRRSSACPSAVESGATC